MAPATIAPMNKRPWRGMRRSPTARAREALAWLLIGAGLALALFLNVIRPWYLRWGATDEERGAALPGDEFVTAPITQVTRAITINAPPETVWPWVAQLGQGRGGFYSYAWIPNLLGTQIVNADRVLVEFQHPQPGDLVRMGPENGGPPPYVVASVQPNQALVLGHHLDLNDPTSGWADSWQFVLRPGANGTTRLLLRSRTFQAPAINTALEPAVFIMERGMLRGIKARAEAAR